MQIDSVNDREETLHEGAEVVVRSDSLEENSSHWNPGGGEPFGLAQELAAATEAGPLQATSYVPGLVDSASAGADGRTFGKFRILRELGRGGFGVVFLAVDPDLRRQVALKLPHAGAASTPDVRERFVREARAAAALDHPNLVPLYEAGDVGSVQYLASAYCEGPTLARWLKERTEPVVPIVAARLIRDMADAVQHAHDRGVLHRDLKPSNVLMQCRPSTHDANENPSQDSSDCGGFIPRITDFGLARMMDRPNEEMTATFVAMGSAPYMPPEQAEGKKVGPAADVYGLGTILYTLLCRRPPHCGKADLETLRKVIEEEPVAPHSLRPEIPRDLEAICLQCLEKDPTRRYPSARALAEDLDRFLGGRPVRARPAGHLEHLRRRARRNPSAAILFSISTVLAVTILGGSFWFRSRLAETWNLAHRREAEALRRDRYVADIRQAGQAIGDHQTARAVDLLTRHVPAGGETDLRCFVWHHLMGRCHTQRRTLTGHRGDVYHAEFSPDGSLVASSGLDGAVRIWRTDSGELLQTIPAHPAEVNWVAFSPDGRRLATACDDGSVRLWDLATSRMLHDIKAHRGIAVIVRFHPDGRQIFTCGRDDGDVKTWDTATGQLVGRFHADDRPLENMAISPDGTVLAVVGQSEIATLWSARGVPRARLFPHGDVVLGVAFSNDGKRVATGCGDGAVRIWEVPTGQLVSEYMGRYAAVHTVTFLPDDKTLVSSGDDPALYLWDVASRRPKGAHLGHLDRVWGVACSPDGRTIVSASREGTVGLWPSQPPEAFSRLSMPEPPRVLAFTSDSRFLIASSAGGLVATWDSCTGQAGEARRIGEAGATEMIVLDRQGELAAVRKRDDSIEIRKIASGERLGTINPGKGTLSEMVFDPGSSRLAVVLAGKEVSVWEASPQPRRLGSLPGDYMTAAFGPLGEVVCPSLQGHRLTVSNPDDGNLRTVRLTHTNPPLALAFSRDEKRLACSHDRPGVDILDWTTRELVSSLKGRIKPVRTMDFSADASVLASAESDGIIRLWNVASGDELLTIRSEPGAVRQIRFSPDGTVLAAAVELPDGRGEVLVWHAPAEGTR